jgi:hypothetical protein
MLCWVAQYGVQFAMDERLLRSVQLPYREAFESLARSESISEFLETLGPSRLLVWLPPGWSTAAMGSPLIGSWRRSLGFVALSMAFVALLLSVHAQIVHHLHRGAALRVGAERVRTRDLRVRTRRLSPPGPPGFWALVRKDWLYLRRSPLPRRLFFTSLLSVLGMIFVIARESPRRLASVIPLMVVAFAISVISLVINLGLAANQFGAVDREGYGTLALAGVDRRQVLLAANLVSLAFVTLPYLILVLIVGLVSRTWVVVPLGLYLGLCMQVGGLPAYNLAAIVGPYRAQLEISGNRSRGNLWGVLAWFVAALPVLALTVLPYVYWRPGLALTLPLGALYSVGLYVATLRPLARLLQRREYEILRAIALRE